MWFFSFWKRVWRLVNAVGTLAWVFSLGGAGIVSAVLADVVSLREPWRACFFAGVFLVSLSVALPLSRLGFSWLASALPGSAAATSAGKARGVASTSAVMKIERADVQIEKLHRRKEGILVFFHVVLIAEGKRRLHNTLVNFIFPRDVLSFHECHETEALALDGNPARIAFDPAEDGPLLDRGVPIPADLWMSHDRVLGNGRTHYWFHMLVSHGGRYAYRMSVGGNTDELERFVHNGELHI